MSPEIIKIIIGFLGCGGVAFLIFNFSKIFSKDPKEILKNIDQKRDHKKIDNINKKEEVIIRQIKLSEKASDESKKKINEITKKAVIEINNVLKEDSISVIDSIIEEDWDDI